MVIINSKATANVEIPQVKALRPDLLGKADHNFCRVLEDVYLQTSDSVACMPRRNPVRQPKAMTKISKFP